MKINVNTLLKNVLWAIVVLYGVVIAVGVYWSFFANTNTARNVKRDWLDDIPILVIRHDGLYYDNTKMTEGDLVDMTEKTSHYFYYLADPSVDVDSTIAMVNQLMEDHDTYVYLWNLAAAHKQNFIMEHWR